MRGKWILWFAVPAVALALAGCGGGGGSSADGGGGIGGSGKVSVGTITGFGSLLLNGVEIQSDAATEFAVEGRDNATEADLAVGMVVRADVDVAEDGTQTATRVVFEDILEGPVDGGSINPAAMSFGILGQTILTADALFEGVTFETVADGNVLEVSGFVDADGNIRATRIELKAADFLPNSGDELEISGTVTGLNEAGRTFFLGALEVDYGTVQPRNGTLADGVIVEVKSTAGVVGGALVASDVEIRAGLLDGLEGAEIELEGFITAFTSVASFQVNGQPVTTDAETTYENGTAADLALNQKVEVEGAVDAQGVLLADKVSIRRAQNTRLEATVEQIGADFVTLLGVTVRVDALTLFQDSFADLRPFTLADIQVDDWLEVRAGEVAGEVLASIVERDDPRAEVTLQGTVGEKSPTNESLTILGVTVNTDPVATSYQDGAEENLSRPEFYQRVTEGVTVVKAQGSFDGLEIQASEVSIER